MSQMMKRIVEKSILEQSKRGLLQVVFSRTMLIMVLIVLQFAYIIARMFSFAQYIPIFLGGEILIVAVMMFVILNSKENPLIKLSWCILVGLLPIFGSIVYLIVRFDIGHRLQQKRIQMSEKESLKHLPEQDEILDTLYEEDRQTYHIANYLRKYSGSSVSDNSPIKYFPIGEQQFEEMLKQLEAAKDFIFMEYFMIGQGYMWSTILEILIRKAKEGVDVRLLYDGSCAVYLLPYNYPKKLELVGIKCRMFSPPIPFLSTHYNNRDHRKIMVIDGHTAFTGGINLCDEYINRDKPFGHWKDVGIMLQGDAVRDFTLMFLQMWGATEHKPVIEEQFLQKKGTSGQYGYVIPYRDSPEDKENVGEMVYLDILNQAKEYVYIMTPYLILDHEMLTAICFAAKRGVDVRIILPHIPDKKTAFALAKTHYKELVEAGVYLYEYTPGFVHAKMFVSDGCKAVVGTANLDYRSLYLNYECSAYLYKAPVISDILADYEETLEKCEKITMDSVRNISVFYKVMGFLLKLVAPLM